MNLSWIGSAAAAAAAVVLAALAPGHRPALLLINETPSVPRGLYLRASDPVASLGALVTIAQPKAVRPYLASLGVPPRVRLLKRVAAVGGEAVCASPGWLRTPRHAVVVPSRDRRGRALPAWRGCRPLAADELLLLGDSITSFDGRYFGPERLVAIEATYTKVLTW